MGFLENALAFVFVLGVMVLIHELGHYWAARWFDVRVESFSFGFGPRLFGFQRGETDFKVCLLPLGGYVKMAGEPFGDAQTPLEQVQVSDPRELFAKPRWQRLIILAAGPAANMVLAVALLTGLYMAHYERLTYITEPPVIAAVTEGSPAERAGLQPGDRIVAFDGRSTPDWETVRLAEVTAVGRSVPVLIERGSERLTVNLMIEADDAGAGSAGWIPATPVRLDPVEGSPAEAAGIEPGDVVVSINGRPIRQTEEAIEAIQQSQGAELTMRIRRGEQLLDVRVTPQYDDSGAGEPAYRIGAMIGPERTVTRLGPLAALRQAVQDNVQNAGLTFRFLKGLFEQRMSARSLEGPLGIARLSGQAARRGWPELILLMANISLQLGSFTLLPIPVLDGGGILVLLVESAMRRDFSLQLKERILQVGLVFLLLLFTFVMYNDIVKTLPGG